jgi:cardiolipin-specific phospholipase
MKFMEAFRVARQLDEFYLVGHSLGGYLSSLYAIRFPKHVTKLLLVSPVGFTEKIEDFDIRRIEVQ